jgi:hypothetical protein
MNTVMYFRVLYGGWGVAEQLEHCQILKRTKHHGVRLQWRLVLLAHYC